MKFNTKTKKILAIGIISLIVVVVFVYFMNRSQVAKAEETITGAGTTNSENSKYQYSAPGTSLTQIGKNAEALELQERYAGMSKEAIIADYIEYRMNRDSGMLNFLTIKANEKGKSLTTVKREDAIYLLEKFNVPGF